MVEAHATARYVRTSAQKAGLVLDIIRGRDVNSALTTLRFARKSVARDIDKTNLRVILIDCTCHPVMLIRAHRVNVFVQRQWGEHFEW